MTEVLYSGRTKPACDGCIRTLLYLNNGTQIFIKKLQKNKKPPRELMIEAIAEFIGRMSTVLLPSIMSRPVSVEICAM